MDEKTKNPEELVKDLENVEVTELDDESLEGVAGGADVPENGNCGNTQCCGIEAV